MAIRSVLAGQAPPQALHEASIKLGGRQGGSVLLWGKELRVGATAAPSGRSGPARTPKDPQHHCRQRQRGAPGRSGRAPGRSGRATVCQGGLTAVGGPPRAPGSCSRSHAQRSSPSGPTPTPAGPREHPRRPFLPLSLTRALSGFPLAPWPARQLSGQIIQGPGFAGQGGKESQQLSPT